MKKIDWVFIKGGICSFGDKNTPIVIKDLLWARTLLTYEQISFDSEERANYPVVNLSYLQALSLAKKFGARLPKSSEWEWMAAGSECREYPWGNSFWEFDKANIQLSGLKTTCPVGNYYRGATPNGILDVAGNVWEFTSSIVHKDGVIIRGGSFNSTPLQTKCKFWNSLPLEMVSLGVGMRFVKEIN